MISISDLGKSFGDRTLFARVSLELDSGERYGLVGANGSGKTTLLDILAGRQEPSRGSVWIPKGTRLGVLRQDQLLHGDEEILGVTLRGNLELWQALVEKQALLAAPDAEFDVHQFSHLEETIQRHDGYAAESRASEILEGLGIPSEVHHQPLSTLSGGFRLRVLLAQALAGAPHALLLDEPTNHLDILSIRWLEKFLRDFPGPVVVVSHDHRFLDNVCTQVLDVDYGTVVLYPGNYDDFVAAKQAERDRRDREIANRKREIAHHQKFVDRFRAKASKARQAQSRLRMIEKKAEGLEPLPESSRRYPAFRFDQARHSGKKVLEVRGIRKAFGSNEVLHGVDLEVRRGDRLAIMGPNGIGKSTLLKIMVGELAADSGSVEWGYETHPGYFAQDHREQFAEPDRTAEEWLWEACPGESYGFVRGELGRVLFTGDDGKKRLGTLSGGEAARLVFARLALGKPNVLVLDEPTNHLDLESIEALVEGLKAYRGTLLLVSHDRWLVSRLADRIVEITPGGMRDFAGSYEDYVHSCGDDHLDVDSVVLRARRDRRSRKSAADASAGASAAGAGSGESAGAAGERGRAAAAVPTAREVRELTRRREDITARIERAESRVAEIDRAFADAGLYDRVDREELRAMEAERSELVGRIESWLVEWEEVERTLEATAD